MLKTSKQQDRAVEHCMKIISRTQKAMELIKQFPLKRDRIYVQLVSGISKGDVYIEAVITPLSYSITSMRVFVHASTIRMFGDNRIQYSQLLDFKAWEPSMAPLTINWITQSEEFKAKAYNI